MNFDYFNIVAYLTLFVCAYTLHELGHVIYLKLKKIDYESGIDDVGQYYKLKNVTRRESIECALSGILSGLIVFIVYFSPIMVLFYLAGSYHDILLVMGVKR